jgi:hypothetical protein
MGCSESKNTTSTKNIQSESKKERRISRINKSISIVPKQNKNKNENQRNHLNKHARRNSTSNSNSLFISNINNQTTIQSRQIQFEEFDNEHLSSKHESEHDRDSDRDRDERPFPYIEKNKQQATPSKMNRRHTAPLPNTMPLKTRTIVPLPSIDLSPPRSSTNPIGISSERVRGKHAQLLTEAQLSTKPTDSPALDLQTLQSLQLTPRLWSTPEIYVDHLTEMWHYYVAHEKHMTISILDTLINDCIEQFEFEYFQFFKKENEQLTHSELTRKFTDEVNNFTLPGKTRVEKIHTLRKYFLSIMDPRNKKYISKLYFIAHFKKCHETIFIFMYQQRGMKKNEMATCSIM